MPLAVAVGAHVGLIQRILTGSIAQITQHDCLTQTFDADLNILTSFSSLPMVLGPCHESDPAATTDGHSGECDDGCLVYDHEWRAAKGRTVNY